MAVFNLGATPMRWEVPAGAAVTPLEGHGFRGTLRGDHIFLEGFDAFFGMQRGEPNT